MAASVSPEARDRGKNCMRAMDAPDARDEDGLHVEPAELRLVHGAQDVGGVRRPARAVCHLGIQLGRHGDRDCGCVMQPEAAPRGRGSRRQTTEYASIDASKATWISRLADA